MYAMTRGVMVLISASAALPRRPVEAPGSEVAQLRPMRMNLAACERDE